MYQNHDMVSNDQISPCHKIDRVHPTVFVKH